MLQSRLAAEEAFIHKAREAEAAEREAARAAREHAENDKRLGVAAAERARAESAAAREAKQRARAEAKAAARASARAQADTAAADALQARLAADDSLERETEAARDASGTAAEAAERLAELRARSPSRHWLWLPAAILAAALAGYLWGLQPSRPAALEEPLKLKLERSLSVPRS
jgi:hypothetical protein